MKKVNKQNEIITFVYISLGEFKNKYLYRHILFTITQNPEFKFQHDIWMYDDCGEEVINIATTKEYLIKHKLLYLLDYEVTEEHLKKEKSRYVILDDVDIKKYRNESY